MADLNAVSLASKVIERGGVIPQPAPGPQVTVPLNVPPPGPHVQPDTGDNEPTGSGCSSLACRVKVVGGVVVIVVGGAAMNGTGIAKEGEEPYPIPGAPPSK